MLKRIFQQLAWLSFFFIAIYLALFILAHVLYPEQSIMDMKISRETIYHNDATFVVLGRNPLMRNTNKIIILGSSNVRVGLRPGEFQKYAKGYEVHSMSIGGANLSQMRQVIKLIMEVTPPESLRNSIFIFGIIPDSFLGDDRTKGARGGITRVQEQQIKWRGLYTLRGGEMVPKHSPRTLYYIDKILYPYLLLNRVTIRIKEIASGAQRRLFKPANFMSVPPDRDIFLNAAVANAKVKKRDLEYMNSMLKDKNNMFPEDQFLIMLDLAKMLTSLGAKTVFVDLPMPKWAKEGSACYPNYQIQKLKYFKELTSIPNTYYVNMQDMDDELYFFDCSHPKPRYSYMWSDRLAKEISSILH